MDTVNLDTFDFDNSKYKFIRKKVVKNCGILYVVTNVTLEATSTYKIGMTRGSLSSRLSTMNTSHIQRDRMYMVHSVESSNVSLFEKMLHYTLRRYRDSGSKEFFTVGLDTIKRAIDRVSRIMVQLELPYDE